MTTRVGFFVHWKFNNNNNTETSIRSKKGEYKNGLQLVGITNESWLQKIVVCRKGRSVKMS